MTHGEYELKCRREKTEDKYYTEAETIERVYSLISKYNLDDKFESHGWFERQVEVASYLGVPYSYLYMKAINLENLFLSASLERAGI